MLLCMFYRKVLLALNGLQMLLNYEVVPPAEVHSILRVLTVQVEHAALLHDCVVISFIMYASVNYFI